LLLLYCLSFRVLYLLKLNSGTPIDQSEADEGEAEAAAEILAAKSAAAAAAAEAADKSKKTHIIKVVGNLAVFVERLASEYMQSLRNIDPHSEEYIERLADESDLVSLAERVQAYLERVGDHFNASRMALLVIEHIYYKHNSIAQPVFAAQHVIKVCIYTFMYY
jgi:translation initiation factor 3 subunit C